MRLFRRACLWGICCGLLSINGRADDGLLNDSDVEARSIIQVVRNLTPEPTQPMSAVTPPQRSLQIPMVMKPQRLAEPGESVLQVNSKGIYPRSAKSTVRVMLPLRADEPFHLEDPKTGLFVEARPTSQGSNEAQTVENVAVYLGNNQNHALIYRPTSEGIEDLQYLTHPPDTARVEYEVALGPRVAGLRLVAGVLEFLDAQGAPRLRVSPPVIIDKDRRVVQAAFRLEGCRVDRNPEAPWGRAITDPGATHCSLVVDTDWNQLAYPAVLDPSWMTTANMAERRYYHVGVRLPDDRVLVAGGFYGSSFDPHALASCELYDPASGTWAMTGSMSDGRYEHAGAVIAGNHVLVMGGNNRLEMSIRTAELYDEGTGEWSSVSGLSYGRFDHTATGLPDGKSVLVVGGMGTVSPTFLNQVERFDYDKMKFVPTDWLRDGRLWQSTVALRDGRILVSGGQSATAVLASAEIYDPSQGSWSQAAPMLLARTGHTATLLADGKVLVVGGANGMRRSEAEIYDPANDEWNMVGMLGEARQAHKAILLDNGHALVVGGILGTAPVSHTVEAYDPVSETWSFDEPLPMPLFGYSLNKLPGGKVLLSGGEGGQPPDAFDIALVYTPSTTKKANGIGCTSNAECQSNHCVDGLCCDSACTDQCAACNVPNHQGVCSAVSGAPVGDRPACGGTDDTCRGVCDGVHTEACRFPDTTIVCRGSASCVDDEHSLPAGTCDGEGNCAEPVPVDCAPYLCIEVSGACASHCTDDADCTDSFCNANGRCAGSDHNGTPCGSDGRCASGYCVDGVCCESDCRDDCTSCALPGKEGICSVVPAGAVGRCAGEGVCAGQCDGVSRACTYPSSEMECGAQSCAGGVVTAASSCDGQGECAPGKKTRCGSDECNEDGTDCTEASTMDGGADGFADHGDGGQGEMSAGGCGCTLGGPGSGPGGGFMMTVLLGWACIAGSRRSKRL